MVYVWVAVVHVWVGGECVVRKLRVDDLSPRMDRDDISRVKRVFELDGEGAVENMRGRAQFRVRVGVFGALDLGVMQPSEPSDAHRDFPVEICSHLLAFCRGWGRRDYDI